MSAVFTRPATYGRDKAFRRFSVDEYERMVCNGILTAADKVELLEHCVVLKMSRNSLHDSAILRSQRVLFRCCPPGWDVRAQSAVRLADSKPEPDIAIVRARADDYRDRHPGPDDIGLVIEVADSSIQRDTTDKARIYARAGLPVYWVVNLIDHRLDIYTGPSGPTRVPSYSTRRAVAGGETVFLELPGAASVPILVADLLPVPATP